MTELSDKLLVAYVDGQLAREQNRAVEKVLEQDDVTAARAKALQEGHSRLEAAFEAILAGEVSEISAQTAPVEFTEHRERGGLAKASLGMAGIVILLITAAASYGWLPFIPHHPVLRDATQRQEIRHEPRASVEQSTPEVETQPSAAASTRAAEAFESNSDAAVTEKVERADQRGFVVEEEQQVQDNINVAESQPGPGNIDPDSKLSGAETPIAVPAGDADYAGLSEADRTLPPAENAATPAPDETTANPAAEAAERNSDAAPMKEAAGDEALHPKTGAGELVAEEEQRVQDNTNAADSQIGPGPIDFGSLADSKTTAAEAADEIDSQSDRAAPAPETPSGRAASNSDAEDPVTRAPNEITPIPAAEAPDGNSATSLKKAGNETPDSKTVAGGFVAKGVKTEQPTENKLNAHAQQPTPLPATKSLKHEEASASAKKPLAHKVKPSAPELRRGARLKETASKSRSKPFTLGTAGGLLPGKVSNRRASASDYATKVRQALGRHKPRSVGTSGSVTVSFAIGTSGALRNARISRSSGKPQLDQGALAIVRRAAPLPRLTRGGQPSYTITINFR